MKRCEQLQKLSCEHKESLVMADKIAEIAECDDQNVLMDGIDILKKYNETELEVHLQHEERTIFVTVMQHYREHAELCIDLGKEHGFMRTIVEEITPETAKKDLADFARVLRNHSLREEQELFPIIESVFTAEQLDEVLNFVPWLPLH